VKVPLVDLSRQYTQVQDDIATGWSKVIDQSSFVLGPEVAEFERAFADFSQVGNCIGVGNGTDALELALRALDIGVGDEVILPANTFIATALAPLRAGASIRLVDCDPGTYLMDIDQAVASVGPRTKVLMPVHLFGQMAPVEELMERLPGVYIIEDAAQAQGAKRHGKRAGSWGHLAGTSFYPGKNLGAFGDAGAVLTNDDEAASRVRTLHNWGSDRKYHHPVAGFNSRLDTLQAVVLTAKLAHLEDWNRQRRAAAAVYDQFFAGNDSIALPRTLAGNEHIHHLYVVEVENRDSVLDHLHQAGIGAGVHYPVPIHLQGALSDLGHSVGDFPHTERAASRMISLPMFPGITSRELGFVAEVLTDAVAQ
jgi:dTDP-4-amino-4,6-dideoxygalactose transaminase